MTIKSYRKTKESVRADTAVTNAHFVDADVCFNAILLYTVLQTTPDCNSTEILSR